MNRSLLKCLGALTLASSPLLASAATYIVRVPISTPQAVSPSAPASSTPGGRLALVSQDSSTPLSSTNFGNVPVSSGVDYGGNSYFIGNTGTAPVSITGISSSGNGGNFALSSGYVSPSCDSLPTLNPGQMCSFQMDFSPTATGAQSASVTITGSDGESLAVPFTGTGITGGNLEIVTGSDVLDFGSVPVGQFAWNEVVLVNVGTSNVTLASIGAFSAPFAVETSNTPYDPPCAPNQVLSPGGSCGVYVGFTPTSTATFTGGTTVTATDGESVSASWSGIGVAPKHTLTASVSGPGLSNASGGNVTPIEVTVTNTGNMDAQPLPSSPTGDFSLMTSTCAPGGAVVTLSPGASCQDTYTFTGKAAESTSVTYTDALSSTSTASATLTGSVSSSSGYALFNGYLSTMGYLGASPTCPAGALNLGAVTNFMSTSSNPGVPFTTDPTYGVIVCAPVPDTSKLPAVLANDGYPANANCGQGQAGVVIQSYSGSIPQAYLGFTQGAPDFSINTSWTNTSYPAATGGFFMFLDLTHVGGQAYYVQEGQYSLSGSDGGANCSTSGSAGWFGPYSDNYPPVVAGNDASAYPSSCQASFDANSSYVQGAMAADEAGNVHAANPGQTVSSVIVLTPTSVQFPNNQGCPFDPNL